MKKSNSVRKLLSIILSLTFIFCAFDASLAVESAGVVYYVSETGNDSNSGMSATAPFKTIAKVNSLSLNSGDTVLFERGSIWRGETLECQPGVTYDAYGTGAQPAFYGSHKNYARECYWEPTIVNHVYKTTFELAEDIGAIVIDNGQLISVRLLSNNPNDLYGSLFLYNANDHRVYFRCTSGNPGVAFSDIEFIQQAVLIDGNGSSNVTIQNITLKYGNYGYRSTGETAFVTLRNLDIAYIGGRANSQGTRAGNGIEFYGQNVHDILVEDCIVTQCYDTAFTCQMGDYNTYFNNITVENCDFSYCYWTVEMWHLRNGQGNTSTATISNVNFISNRFAYAGYGFGGGGNYPNYNSSLDPDSYNYGIRPMAAPATLVNNFAAVDSYIATPDVNFINNIFCDSRDYLFYSGYDMDFSGNTFIFSDETEFGMLGGSICGCSISETLEEINAIDSSATFKCITINSSATFNSIDKIATSVSPYAYNVISDGGFEKAFNGKQEYVTNGNLNYGTTGWTQYGSHTVESGALKVDKDDDFAFQSLTLPAGDFMLSFQAKAFDSGNVENRTSCVSLYDANIGAYVFQQSYNLNTNSFSTIEVPFSINASGTYTLRIGNRWEHLFGQYIDNISITEPIETSTGVDLSNEDGWYCENNLEYSRDKIKGICSLNTASADVNGKFRVKVNTPYKISWWYYGDCDITVNDENGNHIFEKELSSNDWEYYEYYFTTPETCERLNIGLSGCSLYDEFVLSPYPGYKVFAFDNGFIACADNRFVRGENLEFFAYSRPGYGLDNKRVCVQTCNIVKSNKSNGYITESETSFNAEFNSIVDYAKNGDFCNGINEWNQYGSHTVESGALKVDKDDDFAFQSLTLPAGDFVISFQAKAFDSGNVESRTSMVRLYDAVKGEYVFEKTYGLNTASFSTVEIPFCIETSRTYTLRIGNRWENKFGQYIDNVKITKFK